MASFSQYSVVICHTHPEKAVTVWGHLAVVISCQNWTTSGRWKGYDVSLRHSYSSMDEANFLLNQCLFTQAMVENSEPLQHVTPPGPMPVAPQRLEERGCRLASHGTRAGLAHQCHAGSFTLVFDVVGNMPEGFVPQLMCLLEMIVIMCRTKGGGGGGGGQRSELNYVCVCVCVCVCVHLSRHL